MTKFMNAELERIRDNLACGHCAATFQGSDSQARKVKYEKLPVYCSSTCRHAAMRNRFSKPLPNRGPCKHCGKEFFSRTAKQFCCLDCYIQSDQFKRHSEAARAKSLTSEKRLAPLLSAELRARIAAGQRTGDMCACLECGTEFYRPLNRKGKRKFCGRTCYRSHLAKRFDRWVANPEGLALPQCYDEFLDREELPCLVEGCDWKGRHLTLHVNQAHGIRAEEFKRAAGFNLSTGVIAKPLAELLQDRAPQGVANEAPDPARLAMMQAAVPKADMRYRSAEGREHYRKARAISATEAGPQRTCKGCGAVFRQSTPFGRMLYCATSCRDRHYAAQRRDQRAAGAHG